MAIIILAVVFTDCIFVGQMYGLICLIKLEDYLDTSEVLTLIFISIILVHENWSAIIHRFIVNCQCFYLADVRADLSDQTRGLSGLVRCVDAAFHIYSIHVYHSTSNCGIFMSCFFYLFVFYYLSVFVFGR